MSHTTWELAMYTQGIGLKLTWQAVDLILFNKLKFEFV